jgi:putative redox protein
MIITRMVSDEVFESVNDNGNKVSIDMRKLEERKSQSPTELLLSALAACGAVDIVAMLKKRKKTIDNFIIETNGTRRTEAPKYFTDIHCKYVVTSKDVTEEELQKVSALALEKYCSVSASLNSNITFSVQVIRP